MDLIWDFDGTIMDTYPIMVDAFVDALIDMRIDEFEIDDYEINQVMRRHSLATCVQKYAAHFNIDADTINDKYRQYEKQNVKDANIFMNVDKVLAQNVDDGGRNFLLTHRDDDAIAMLEDAGLKDCFTEMVTKNQAFKRKPDPEAVNYLIKNNDINRDDCMFMGDRKLDVDAAHNAGIKACLFDPDGMINSTGNPEMTINNYYDFLHRND